MVRRGRSAGKYRASLQNAAERRKFYAKEIIPSHLHGLKRNVQQTLVSDLFNPFNWPPLAFGSFTRSDLAANYCDEILFP